MNKTFLLVPALGVIALISEAVSNALGYEIQWPAVGICLTTIVAIWKLREDSDQKAIDRELQSKREILDRELQTKREILLAGVQAMTKAQAAFASLSTLKIDYQEASSSFQKATAKLTMAATVASLDAARSGNEYVGMVGPLFLQAMQMRADLDALPDGPHNPIFSEKHNELGGFILDNAIETGKSMLRVVAAVRQDIGISKESTEQFLDAVYPDEAAFKLATDKLLGRTGKG